MSSQPGILSDGQTDVYSGDREFRLHHVRNSVISQHLDINSISIFSLESYLDATKLQILEYWREQTSATLLPESEQ